MGRTPLYLSRSAKTSLLTAMLSAQPVVIRSALTEQDMTKLVEEWAVFMAEHKTLYQMGEGRGMHTLSTMWNSPMRLEHDLRNSSTIPNPVMTWLSLAQPGSVAARVWHLQEQLEGVAASQSPVLRRPAFATGIVLSEGRGNITHFDDYNNTALVLTSSKTFLIAPPDAMSWEDGPRNGNRNERLDVNPLLQGRRYPEPPLAQWQRAHLSPGDVLYLPSGWWHHVVSASNSLMTNLWTG
jgi:hypothetical protein